VKGDLRPGKVKRLYTDEKNTEIGEIKQLNNRKGKKGSSAAYLIDLYPSTCMAWEALPKV